MPFELSTAKPVISKNFDLATAKPVRTPGVGDPLFGKSPEERAAARAELEARSSSLQDEAAAARDKAEKLGRIREPVRRATQIATAPGRGIAAALEFPQQAASGLLTAASGGSISRLPSVAGMLDDPSLAPQNAVERFERRGLEFAGGALAGVGAGQFLSKAGGETARGVGRTLAENPGRQLIGAGTGAGAAQATEEAGGGDVAQQVAAVLGAAPAAVGARPKPPATSRLPKGGEGALGKARALGLKIPPSTAAIQPERVGKAATGLTRQRLSGPGFVAHFQVENQKIVNQGIAKAVGLDGSKPLAAQIKPALNEFNKVAQKVADTIPALIPDEEFVQGATALGKRVRDNPVLANSPAVEKLRDRLLNVENLTGQQALDAIRELRANAKVSLQSVDDFDKHQVGRAMKDAANLLEGALERAATVAGEPGLVQQFRQGRVRAAQLHDIDNALIGDNIDLAALSAAGPENLSGKLRQFAEVQQEFPTLTRTQSKISPDSGALSLAFSPVILSAQRQLGGRFLKSLMSERFQRQFGDIAPETPDVSSTIAGKAPPPNLGGVDFEPTGGLPPGGAFRNPSRPGELELVPDQLGDIGLPPATARPGDLTAEVPPALFGDLDFAPTNLDDNFPRNLGDAFATAPDQGVFPGAKVPEEAALTEFISNAPIERRRLASGDFGEAERRSSILRERQAVLDQPIGAQSAGQSIADELLADPRMRAAVKADTRANRAILNPDEDLPIGDASVQAAVDELERLGFTPEEIAEILRTRG